MTHISPHDSTPIRFIMLGGFLGAGKTTTLARLARHYQAAGKTVALVTNDKAADLVDTLKLRAEGFNVGELPGACFCGNVDELVGMVDALGVAALPEVVLAEPVGSCLDIVATIVRPLVDIYGRRFEVSPYGILLKPTHAAKILRREVNAGVSPKAAYIFRTQIEEADFVAINRADVLSPEQVAELTGLLAAEYPGRPVVAMSATTGQGFESLVELLERRGTFAGRRIDLDYDAYSAGEAELGWLNGTILIDTPSPADVDKFLREIVEQIRKQLRAAGATIAHLKAIGMAEGRYAALNVIADDAASEVSHTADCQTTHWQLVVNARVACDPATLEAGVETGLRDAASRRAASLEFAHWQCFAPGRPELSRRTAVIPFAANRESHAL